MIKLLLKYDDQRKDTAEVWVKAKIDDVWQECILDTGCAQTSLCFNEFSAKYPSQKQGQYMSAFGIANYDSIEVKAVELGPLSKSDLTLFRTQEGGNDKNLLGMDFLKTSALHFSFSQNTVSPTDHISTETHEEIDFGSGQIPSISVLCGSQKLKGVWDTGAGITLVDQRFIDSHPQLFESLEETKGTDATGREFTTPTYLMKSLSIFGHKFPDHRIVPIDLSQISQKVGTELDLVLGYSTLRYADWWMDFPNNNWNITKFNFPS